LPRLTHAQAAPKENISKTAKLVFGGEKVAAKTTLDGRDHKHLKCLARDEALLPTRTGYYDSICKEPRHYGAGLPVRWPLHHDLHWVCRITDMVLATRICEAYEFGFRGHKRRQLTLLQQIKLKTENENFETSSSKLSKASRVFEVSCDLCGLQLADSTNTGPFYFCGRCKQSGCRYELCVSCHALEIVQSEGKYFGDKLHPHWTNCAHDGLVRFSNIRDAYPFAPHLRRVCCDFCGHMIYFHGSDEDACIYICETCPAKHGYRFELCESCSCWFWDRQFDSARETQRQEHTSRPIDNDYGYGED